MRVIGLDIGERRIGVALSDRLGLTAQPHSVIDRDPRDRGGAVGTVAALVRSTGAERVVAGLPLDLSGEVGRQARLTLIFVEALEERLEVPVETWDERFSTAAAERALLEGNVRRAKRRQVRDKVAAALILQTWLDARGMAPP